MCNARLLHCLVLWPCIFTIPLHYNFSDKWLNERHLNIALKLSLFLCSVFLPFFCCCHPATNVSINHEQNCQISSIVVFVLSVCLSLEKGACSQKLHCFVLFSWNQHSSEPVVCFNVVITVCVQLLNAWCCHHSLCSASKCMMLSSQFVFSF